MFLGISVSPISAQESPRNSPSTTGFLPQFVSVQLVNITIITIVYDRQITIFGWDPAINQLINGRVFV
jgi:hypothetical protein